MRACPYPAAVTVPSSATAATCVLSEANETPVASPITAPASSAKLARSAYRLLSGRPTRVADSLSPAAITRIDHVTASPSPGPRPPSCVLPARLPVRTVVGGFELARGVLPPLH